MAKACRSASLVKANSRAHPDAALTRMMVHEHECQDRVLVTGASGYVGGRLVPVLLRRRLDVRAMVRTASRLRDAPWADQVEVAVADVTDFEGLAAALADVDVAYYLVHSIGSAPSSRNGSAGGDDLRRRRPRAAGVRRIVYLGGLTPGGRGAVGAPAQPRGGRAHPPRQRRAHRGAAGGRRPRQRQRQLRDAAPPDRAAAGDGRPEVGRHEDPTDRHPRRAALPRGAAHIPADVNRRFDIGGPDVLTYADMMRRYAAVAGLPNRRMLRVPVLSPGCPATGSAW